MILGMIGRPIARITAGNPRNVVIALIALLLAAREWRWIKFPLPSLSRQTDQVWFYRLGFVRASAIWGLDIGFGFGTFVNYGGFYALVALAVLFGKPSYGALLMIAYWLGRALPVWLAPTIWNGHDSVVMFERILGSRELYQRMAGIALIWMFTVAVFVGLGA
jgi:hypothetical protein